MREIRTSRGQICLGVGRLRGDAVGVLGTDGAWGDDGAFHPLPLGGTNVSLQQFCGDTDANGNGFLNVTDDSAVRNAAGDTSVNGDAHGAAARAPLCPQSTRDGRYNDAVTAKCPAGALRRLDYGLIVSRKVSSSCVQHPGARPKSICPDAVGPVGPRAQSGVITTVRYRDGQICRLPAPSADGGVRPASCPLVGYRAPDTPHVTAAEIASPVNVTISPATHLCVSNAPNPHGCKEVTLHITFTARVAVRSINSYYEAVIDMPPRDYTPGGPTGCPGGGGGLQPIGEIIAAGQQVNWRWSGGRYPKDCLGNHIRVTVAYVANAYLGLNGLGSELSPSPGRGAIVVGRATVALPTH